jgi:hypothetical protein
LAAGVALTLGACGSTTTPLASSGPTAPATTATTPTSPATVPTTTTVPTTSAASTGPALDPQSLADIDTELSGLQSLLGETGSGIAAGKADN